MTDTAVTEKPRISRETQFKIGFGLLVVSVLLALWMPVWLAPPHFANTGLVYAALMWICSAAYGVTALRLRRPGRLRLSPEILSSIVMAVVVTAISLFLLLSASFLQATSFQCQQESVSPSAVRYTCTAGMGSVLETYIFEGPPGFPLVVNVGDR